MLLIFFLKCFSFFCKLKFVRFLIVDYIVVVVGDNMNGDDFFIDVMYSRGFVEFLFILIFFEF